MIPKNAILLPNGDIAFVHRGKPPQTPAGYIRDKGDPYLFHLDVIDCVYRVCKKRQLPCGKYKDYLYCKHFDKEVNQIVCNDCFEGVESV